MLKPIDIREKEFETKMRGYDREEVDNFLNEIMRDMSILYKDNKNLTDEVNELKAKCAELQAKEASINQSLELTKYQCDELLKNSQLEGKAIIDNAKAEAESFLHTIENNKVKIKAFCEELLEKVNRL